MTMVRAVDNQPDRDPAGRVVPHNFDAEEAILGAMLLSHHAIAEATQRLRASDFYRPAHGQIFDAIVSFYMANGGDMPDVTTISEELRRSGVLENAGGKQNLLRLQAVTPASTNAAHYAQIVEDLSALRRLIAAGTEIVELGYASRDTAATLDQAESVMFGVTDRRIVDSLAPITDLLGAAVTDLEERTAAKNTTCDNPQSGFYDLDDALGGLRRQSLVVLAARPGQGKTSLALDIARHVALRQGLPVLFFSLEMGHIEITQRLLSMESRVNAGKFSSGALDAHDWAALNYAAGKMGDAPIFVDDNPRCSTLEMTAKARRLASRNGRLGLIVVDYLQLMGSQQSRRTRENRQVEVSEFSRALKVLARELDCPVLALSQLNRALEYRQDKRPMLADLRESGAIEQDADSVLFIYREDVYLRDAESPPKGLAQVIVAKNRHGSTGTTNLVFRGECTSFENYTGQAV